MKQEELEQFYKELCAAVEGWNNYVPERPLNSLSYMRYCCFGECFVNALDATICLINGDTESPTLAQSCLAAIDSLILTVMMDEKKISPLQAKIYACKYALLDINRLEEDESEKKKRLADKEIALDALSEYMNISKDELKTMDLTHPYIYLLSNPNDGIELIDCLVEILGKETDIVGAYDLLRMVSMPKYNEDGELDESQFKLEEEAALSCLEIVRQYLSDMTFIKVKDDALTFDEAFRSNPEYKEEVHLINVIGHFLKEADKTISKLGNPHSYDASCLRQLSSIWFDMCVNEFIGEPERVISKFRLFLENYGVYKIISNSKDYELLREGLLMATSGKALLTTASLLGETVGDELEQPCRRIYDDFYKNKYDVPFETFFDNMLGNNYYYLGESNPNSLIEEAFFNGIDISIASREEGENLHKLSCYLSCSSGWVFLDGYGHVDHYCRLAMNLVYQSLKNFISDLSDKYHSDKLKERINLLKEAEDFEANCYRALFQKEEV